MARILARLYGHFAAALGSFILLLLPVAHWLPVPGWAYLYALPVLAVAYAMFRTASQSPPTLEELYLEIGRREKLARQKSEDEAAKRRASRSSRATTPESAE
jgi:hypothetical protein